MKIQSVLGRHFTADRIEYPDFTGKADLFAFFIAHATPFLRDGGRLALVLSWSALASVYGDALLAFLARYYFVEAIVESRVERFFAAKQNTFLLMARRAPNPAFGAPTNEHIPPDFKVRLVRLKRPLERLVDLEASRGQRAEDLLDALRSVEADEEGVLWDISLVPQRTLAARRAGVAELEADDADGQQDA